MRRKFPINSQTSQFDLDLVKFSQKHCRKLSRIGDQAYNCQFEISDLFFNFAVRDYQTSQNSNFEEETTFLFKSHRTILKNILQLVLRQNLVLRCFERWENNSSHCLYLYLSKEAGKEQLTGLYSSSNRVRGEATNTKFNQYRNLQIYQNKQK